MPRPPTYNCDSGNMWNIGIGEFAVICIVLIIAVGPERLPAMMKTIGKTLRMVRQASHDFRESVGIDELLREDISHRAAPPRAEPHLKPPVVSSHTELSATTSIPAPAGEPMQPPAAEPVAPASSPLGSDAEPPAHRPDSASPSQSASLAGEDAPSRRTLN